MKLGAGEVCSIFMAATMLVCSSLGCGSKATTVPPSGQCGGTLFTGTVKDSLTNFPIAAAKVVLETGTELSITPIYNFSPSAAATTDAQGAFNLCSNASITTPAVILFEALDQSGNAYPPTVAPALQTASLGTVLVGACHVACGFPGQVQSSASAAISGVVTTSPVGESGTLLAQTAINALDGSKNIWNVTLEGLSAGQSDTFQSAGGTCPVMGDLCSSYAYTLPSQAPVTLVAGVYKQQEAPPTYSISATTVSATSCTEPFLSTSLQLNGSSPLTGVPGSQLTAAVLSFTGCH